MGDHEDKQQETKYQTYLDERHSLTAAEKESSLHFDKSILTLAAGALGLSLTFIDKIAPHPAECTLYLLGLAWIFFSLSVLSSLISSLTSQAACRRQIKIVEKIYFDNAAPNSEKNLPAQITNILNWVSIGLFMLGVFFLVVFTIANLK
jgi:hypothetical protein